MQRVDIKLLSDGVPMMCHDDEGRWVWYSDVEEIIKELGARIIHLQEERIKLSHEVLQLRGAKTCKEVWIKGYINE